MEKRWGIKRYKQYIKIRKEERQRLSIDINIYKLEKFDKDNKKSRPSVGKARDK